MNAKTKHKATAQEATSWFVKLEASDISDKTKADFFSWLDAAPANQQAYIEVEKLWGKLDIVKALPLETAPAGNHWYSILFSRGTTQAVASSVLLVVGLALFFTLQSVGSSDYEYVTAIGERADFRLEDGSLLQLNTNSAVSVHMERSLRLLTLKRGEAYFDIAPDKTRPLLVQTAGGRVRVLGTRFNIRQTGPGSVVSVIEGLVAVSAKNETSSMEDPDFIPDFTLAANQQTELIENQSIAAPIEVKEGTVLAWRRGKLIYEGNTLAEVVSDLNRYFTGTIRLSEPALGELEIVGVLNLRNRTATLAALEATFGVEVFEASENLTLIRPSRLPPQ